MATDLQTSVALITSRDPENNQFGTGFVIHQDKSATYLVTCAHVVDDVGGTEAAINADDSPAKVVAAGLADGLDMAVLRVEGLHNYPPLPLQASAQKGTEFTLVGFQKFRQRHVVRPLEGRLGHPVGLTLPDRPGRISAWDLIIEGDTLQRGYSGSPVVDKTGGQVLAVTSYRQGQGERGLAISIGALPTIWPDMPASLLAQASEAQTGAVTAPHANGKIKLFFSYVPKDKELRDELAVHLAILKRQGQIDDWYDGDIAAGSEHAVETNTHLQAANIILLLISPSFIASDRSYLQMQEAMIRHERGEAVVIPILLRPTTGWKNELFGKLQALPRNGTPVTGWPDRDEALAHITEEIRRVAEKLAAA